VWIFATSEICEICADSSRATELLCVVEQPTDILPLEKTGAFRGRYHSLGGKISPLDHVGPEDLRIKELLQRINAEKLLKLFSRFLPMSKANPPQITLSIC